MESAFFPIILKNLNLPWESVLNLGVPVSFKPRQILTIDNTTNAKGAYYIRNGRIRLSYIAAAGQEKVLFYLGSGSFFNEVPSLSPGVPCIFTCVENTEAVFLRKSLITSSEFVAAHPALIINWLESSSAKLGNMFNQLCYAGLGDVFSNVCRVLYSMCLFNKERNKIVPYLSQQELASLLGVHRGSLHKALTRLRNEGVIEHYSRKELIVLDEPALKNYAMEV